MRKRDMIAWWCLGVMSHDLVSAYLPDGGHVPGVHAWYFALPLLMLALAWPRGKQGEQTTAQPKPKQGVYN